VQTAATTQAAAAARAAREAWEDERERLVSELNMVCTASRGLCFSLPAHASCDEQTEYCTLLLVLLVCQVGLPSRDVLGDAEPSDALNSVVRGVM
jgi:hypothetical protein